jgi:AcrR family transcriptional regulator
VLAFISEDILKDASENSHEHHDEAAHERILSAAMETFSEKGYKTATTREIADKADVNEVTIFRHFASKEGLFEQTVQHYSPPPVLTADLGKKLTGDIKADLTVLANKYLKAAIKNAPYIRLSIMELPRNPDLIRIVTLIPVELSTSVAEYLHNKHENGEIKAADFELLSQMFYDILFHYIISAEVFSGGRGAYSVEKKVFVETTVDLFVSLLTKS